MRCEFCGHKNGPREKFCEECGAQLTVKQDEEQKAAPVQNTRPDQNQDQAPDQYKEGGQYSVDTSRRVSNVAKRDRSRQLKKAAPFAVIIIIVIIAAIILASLIKKPGASEMKDSINFFTDTGLLVVSGNNNPKFTIDGDLASSQKNMDGNKAVALIDYRGAKGGELWFVTTSGCYQIASGVLDYRLSDSGNGVAFITDDNSAKGTATLHLYDTSAKKDTQVTDGAIYYNNNNGGGMIGTCISPNGKSVGYIGNYDPAKNEYTGYVCIYGKDPEALGVNSFAVAISDGGKYIYYAKNLGDGRGNSFFVRNGRNDVRLISDMAGNTPLAFNTDYSEILFNVEDRTFISRKGNERERITGALVSGFILPAGTQTGRNAADSNITVYGMNSLLNTVTLTSDGLVYVNSKLEINKISSSSSYGAGAFISNDSRTLLYINDNGHLSAIDPTKANDERREIGRDVTAFTASNDGKTIYYINSDVELWVVKGSGTPVKIADDVSPSWLVLPVNSGKVFFLVDYSDSRGGDLYYSNNGARRVKVSGGDEVMKLWSTPANVFYLTYDNEIFRSNGNETFSRFEQAVNIIN